MQYLREQIINGAVQSGPKDREEAYARVFEAFKAHGLLNEQDQLRSCWWEVVSRCEL